MKIIIECEGGLKKSVTAYAVGRTPFVLVEKTLRDENGGIDARGYMVTHRASGFAVGPFGWYSRSTAKDAVESWWAQLQPSVQAVLISGKLPAIQKLGPDELKCRELKRTTNFDLMR